MSNTKINHCFRQRQRAAFLGAASALLTAAMIVYCIMNAA